MARLVDGADDGSTGISVLEKRGFSTPIEWVEPILVPVELVNVRKSTTTDGLV